MLKHETALFRRLYPFFKLWGNKLAVFGQDLAAGQIGQISWDVSESVFFQNVSVYPPNLSSVQVCLEDRELVERSAGLGAGHPHRVE